MVFILFLFLFLFLFIFIKEQIKQLQSELIMNNNQKDNHIKEKVFIFFRIIFHSILFFFC